MGAEVKVVPLEPCPFCGSSNVNHRYIRDGQQMFCQDCGGSARPAFHGPKDDTIARAASAWNRRASNPATPKEMLRNLVQSGALQGPGPWVFMTPGGEDHTTPEAQAAYWKGAFERMAARNAQLAEYAKGHEAWLSSAKAETNLRHWREECGKLHARLSLRDTFIAEKGLWSEFAETVLHQQSSLEASGGSNG